MDIRVSVENTGEVERTINIEIPRALYNKEFEDALSGAAMNARLKGFRPAHR